MKLICNVTGDEINPKSIATEGPTIFKSNERFVSYFHKYANKFQIFSLSVRVLAPIIKA